MAAQGRRPDGLRRAQIARSPFAMRDLRPAAPSPVGVFAFAGWSLLARHVQLELCFGVADQLAAEVDGHCVQRPGEAERRLVVVGHC